jgi:hypothetical protein
LTYAERRLAAINVGYAPNCSFQEKAMRQPDSLFDRIMARIKNNPVAAILIAAGTIVIALSTFSNATRSLLDLLKGQSPEAARLELSNQSVQYTRQAFVQSAKQGDTQVVKSGTPRRAGGLMSWAASKAVDPMVGRRALRAFFAI